ncbi:MAG: hypothetical protein KAU29_12520 [Gammaproteobacteria bacterium]|nr:hypothetical protein [Gammaproteobacteria bacterium]
MNKSIFLLISFSLIWNTEAHAEYITAEQESFLFEVRYEVACNSAKYSAKNKAQSECYKKGFSPLIGKGDVTYGECSCWKHPKNSNLTKCKASASIPCLMNGFSYQLIQCSDKEVQYRINSKRLNKNTYQWKLEMKDGNVYQYKVLVSQATGLDNAADVSEKIQKDLCDENMDEINAGRLLNELKYKVRDIIDREQIKCRKKPESKGCEEKNIIQPDDRNKPMGFRG